jgi:hypothetical protein
MWRRVVVAAIVVLALESPVAAQEHWGVNVSLSPSWLTGPGNSALFGSDRVDLHGSEIRVGVVRGIDIDNDWGFSFVSTTIAPDSAVDVDVTPCSRGTCGTFLRTVNRTRMTGFEFHQYQAYKTWRDRVQVGMVGAVGLGWLHGNVYKRTVTPDSDIETLTANAGELYPPSTSVMPLMRLELAGAGIIAPGVKVRVSGGFGLPGYHTFGISFIYLVSSR